MFTARTAFFLSCALLALSWIGSASAAELEIKKVRIQTTASVEEPPYTAVRRVPVSHRPIRLALQDEVRMPAYLGPICIGLILGIGY
jgi:hypothetical protein